MLFEWLRVGSNWARHVVDVGCKSQHSSRWTSIGLRLLFVGPCQSEELNRAFRASWFFGAREFPQLVLNTVLHRRREKWMTIATIFCTNASFCLINKVASFNNAFGLRLVSGHYLAFKNKFKNLHCINGPPCMRPASLSDHSVQRLLSDDSVKAALANLRSALGRLHDTTPI